MSFQLMVILSQFLVPPGGKDFITYAIHIDSSFYFDFCDSGPVRQSTTFPDGFVMIPRSLFHHISHTGIEPVSSA